MESYRSLPKSPGVYLFRDAANKIIYVGKARSLRDRVGSYFKGNLLPKTASLVTEVAKIDHISVESEVDAFLLEAVLIRKHLPKYNITGKDGKSFPYIEISKDPVPIVRVVHHETNLGPYPTGSDIRGLLRFLRKIFPYVTQAHRPGEICFRSHIGLCPCPNYVNYRQNLKNLANFLNGKRRSIQKKLEKEMLAASKIQDFEKAQELKRKLDQINYITSAAYKPWVYELNPNLISDLRNREVEELKKVLDLDSLEKIEGYDIANLAGKSATGAQVVFVNGEPEKSLYRRYKIKLKTTPDDYAMLKEVISRRLKSDIPLPDLMVIDGGRGQINAVKADTRMIGLAKKLETIYTDDGREINLPQSSPALHLLQRIRDEAHRFSRKYHFYLRSKRMYE